MGREVSTPGTPHLAADQVPGDLDWDLGIRFHQAPEHPLRICALDPLLAEAKHCVAEDGGPLFERAPGLLSQFCELVALLWQPGWQCDLSKPASRRAS